MSEASFAETHWPALARPAGEFRIRLHNPVVSQRLDALFERQFAEPRRVCLRVRMNHALKRGLDVAVSAAGLLLLWPVLLTAAVATLCDTGRPVFYSQMRRIRFGRRARIYKMRTLVVGADRNLHALVNIKNNGRFLNIAKSAFSYTRVGRWLERLWIVELPQLWNVLKGEMSLVGNRPIPDYVIDVLGPTPEVAERFASPQGMTGYTQIVGRDAVTDEERIALEYHYSRIFEEGNVFLEDLRIIALTVLTYLGIGRPRTVEDFLPGGLRTAPETGERRPPHRVVPGAEPADAGPATEPELACPTCYAVGDACDSTQCRQECVESCDDRAITLEAGRPVIHANCTACSRCVIACPRQAIDKVPLERADGAARCPACGTRYPRTDGVLDLLPRRSTVAASPYFDFYDKDYLDENPQMHLEDTEWKLRELRPLLEQTGRYENLFDLGCGAGMLGRRIAAGLRIDRRVGADWSGRILAFARGQDPGGTYVRTDAAYLPLRNGSCDLALLIDVIEHQQRPYQVLRELGRVSRRLLLRTPLEDCWYERMRRRRRDLFRESSGHVLHFSAESIRERIERAGWRIVRSSVRHIAWSHWKRVLTGPYPVSSKLLAAGRFGLRWILPTPAYRRLFVTNYNALCESPFAQAARAAERQACPAGGERS